MNFKQRISSVENTLEKLTRYTKRIFGVMTRSEYETACVEGKDVAGVLYVPDPVSREEWERQARTFSEVDQPAMMEANRQAFEREHEGAYES